jgi:hypothetical protein
MFPVSTNLGGMSFGMPDVCLTPAGPAVVPVPYPNMAMNVMANPGLCTFTFIVAGGLAMSMKSMVMLSNGDNGGAVGGVMSGMMMGPARFNLGSFSLLVGGMPAARMTSLTMQNMTNVPMGCNIVPSQVSLMAT